MKGKEDIEEFLRKVYEIMGECNITFRITKQGNDILFIWKPQDEGGYDDDFNEDTYFANGGEVTDKISYLG